MNQIEEFGSLPPPRFIDTFRERTTGNNNLIIVLLLIFDGALIYFSHAATVAFVARQGIEHSSQMTYGDAAFAFLWLWGKLLTVYAVVAASRIPVYDVQTTDDVRSLRISLPRGWVLHWLSLIVFVVLWYVPFTAIFLGASALQPPHLDIHYGFILIQAAYFVARATVLSILALCFFRLFGYWLGILLLTMAMVVKVFLWASMSLELFPNFFPAIAAIDEFIRGMLPWGMGFMWPLQADMLMDTSQWTEVGRCIIQNLAYSAVVLYLLAKFFKRQYQSGDEMTV